MTRWEGKVGVSAESSVKSPKILTRTSLPLDSGRFWCTLLLQGHFTWAQETGLLIGHAHCEEQLCLWFSWLHYSGKRLPLLGLCSMPTEQDWLFARGTLAFVVIWSLKELRRSTFHGKAGILTSLGSPSKSRAKNFCEDKGRRCGKQVSLSKDRPLATLLSCQVLCPGPSPAWPSVGRPEFYCTQAHDGGEKHAMQNRHKPRERPRARVSLASSGVSTVSVPTFSYVPFLLCHQENHWNICLQALESNYLFD